ARFFARQRQCDKALTDFDKALTLDATIPEVWLDRGHCHAELDQLDKTAIDFAKALELLDLPNLPSARAAVDDELAGWDKVFTKVAQLGPADTQLWIAKGRYHARRGQWQPAAAAYGQVIKSRPLGSDAFEYAAVLLLCEDIDGYEKFCQEMIQRGEKTKGPVTTFHLAQTCGLTATETADPAEVVG